MPPVVAPIAIAAVGAVAGVAAGVTTVAAAVISVAVTAAAAGASYLLAPSVGKAGAAVSPATQPTAAPANGQRSVSVAQPVPPRRMVFGNCRVGGVVFYEENDNPHLYIGLALSDGIIESVDGVYFGDTSIPIDGSGDASTGTAYEGYFSRDWANGDPDQTASALLTGAGLGLDANFRQRGAARCVLRLHWGDDATQHNALWGNSVNPSILGRWLRVYDPREAGHDIDDADTWAYSANPVLCVAHVMRFAWGVGIGASSIDWVSVAEAADACDATVTYNEVDVPIFELAGVVQADVPIGNQITEMLSSFAGRINYVQGKYTLRADVARSSVWEILDEDVLELGSYQHDVDGPKYNTLSGVYYDAADSGTRQETTAIADSAIVAAEGERATSVPLPFTPGAHSAQILAYRELQRHRNGRSTTLRVHDAGAYLEPGDVVTVTLTYAAFMSGTYEVAQVDLADVGVLLALKEYVAAAYTDPTTYLV